VRLLHADMGDYVSHGCKAGRLLAAFSLPQLKIFTANFGSAFLAAKMIVPRIKRLLRIGRSLVVAPIFGNEAYGEGAVPPCIKVTLRRADGSRCGLPNNVARQVERIVQGDRTPAAGRLRWFTLIRNVCPTAIVGFRGLQRRARVSPMVAGR
jgi:hypothetical protein